MNGDFEKLVKDKTACDTARLDRAVASGIHRAKSGRLDKMKIFEISVAAAMVLFITVKVEADDRLRENAWLYLGQTSRISEESSRSLHNYINIGATVIWESLQ